MKVTVTSQFKLPARKTWALIQRSDTLEFVTRGLIGFRPLSGKFPTAWQAGVTEQVRILLFGFIPAWKHQISFIKTDSDNMQLNTEEAGGAISRWDHLMTVKATSETSSSYCDSIEIEAGSLTLLIWLYAQGFYRYRHWRWKALEKRQLGS